MPVWTVISLALAGIWCLLIGELSVRQALVGLVFGTLFTLWSGTGRGSTIRAGELLPRLGHFCRFAFVLIPVDLLSSNIVVIRTILRPNPGAQSGIIRIALKDIPPIAAAIEEHAITLTPGQLVVDYTEDQSDVYIHMLDATEAESWEREIRRKHRRLLQRILS